MATKKQLMKISAWRKSCFAPGSEPSMKTVRTWIENGEIPGECIGGMYYVDTSRLNKTGNEMVDRILNA